MTKTESNGTHATGDLIVLKDGREGRRNSLRGYNWWIGEFSFTTQEGGVVCSTENEVEAIFRLSDAERKAWINKDLDWRYA